jgi:hypothetical protein
MTHFCEGAMAAIGEANRVVTIAVMMFTFFVKVTLNRHPGDVGLGFDLRI